MKRLVTDDEKLAFNKLTEFSPENAYVFGFLWADGYVVRPPGRGYGVSLSIKKSDLLQILNLFDTSLGWKISYRARKEWSPQGTARIQNKPFHELLTELDYINKSIHSPSKVLEWLPKHLHKNWWHGYFDGDGCFYTNKKHYTYQICFAGNYDQDWSSCIEVLELLGISPKHNKIKSSNGNSSKLRFTKKAEVKKFLNWIHNDVVFGLKRKRWKVDD
jgi:hypothetical protein